MAAALSRTIPALGLVAALASLAGCGGSDSDSDEESDEESSSGPARCDPESLIWVYDRVTGPDDHAYPTTIFRYQEGREEALTDDDAASAPSLSPDGSQIVFERGSEGSPESAGYSRFRLYVMDSDGGNERPLLEAAYENPPPTGGTAWDRHPVWSPDGAHVAFIRDVDGDSEQHQLMVVAPDGGEPRPVPGSASASDLHDPAPAWSSDSTRLAWLEGGGGDSATLHWASLDGQASGSAQLDGSFGPPAWVDEDRAIAVSFRPSTDLEDDDVGLYLVDTTSGEETELDMPLRALGALPTGELAGLEGSQERAQLVVVNLDRPQDRQEITTLVGSEIMPEGSVGADGTGPIVAVPDAPDGWSACT